MLAPMSHLARLAVRKSFAVPSSGTSAPPWPATPSTDLDRPRPAAEVAPFAMTRSEAAQAGGLARAPRHGTRAPRWDSKHSSIRLRPRPTSTRAKPTELPFEPPTGEAPHVRGEHHA